MVSSKPVPDAKHYHVNYANMISVMWLSAQVPIGSKWPIPNLYYPFTTILSISQAIKIDPYTGPVYYIPTNIKIQLAMQFNTNTNWYQIIITDYSNHGVTNVVNDCEGNAVHRWLCCGTSAPCVHWSPDSEGQTVMPAHGSLWPVEQLLHDQQRSHVPSTSF